MIWGKTVRDDITSAIRIRDMTGVEKIEELMREQRLWCDGLGTWKRWMIKGESKKKLYVRLKKGRPKKRWKEVLEESMLVKGLKRTNEPVRSVWRLGCKNRPIPACTSRVPGGWRSLSGILEQFDDDGDAAINFWQLCVVVSLGKTLGFED